MRVKETERGKGRKTGVREETKEAGGELKLPADVEIRTLAPHLDERGFLVELFRPDWDVSVRPIQWNLTMSHGGVLRGPQFHVHRHEYLVLLDGRMSVGLRDVRRGSPTEGLSVLIEAKSSPEGFPLVTIATGGVLHGFYFHEDSQVLHGTPTIWDVRDEFRVRWDDPELGITWPTEAPVRGGLDAVGSSPLEDFAEFYPAWQEPRIAPPG